MLTAVIGAIVTALATFLWNKWSVYSAQQKALAAVQTAIDGNSAAVDAAAAKIAPAIDSLDKATVSPADQNNLASSKEYSDALEDFMSAAASLIRFHKP